MAVFNGRIVTESSAVLEALQRGAFITDAAAEAGTYRKKGTRRVVACGEVRRRGRNLKGRSLTFAEGERSPSHERSGRLTREATAPA